MTAEFEIIARYFSRPAAHTLLGGGDDCALLAPDDGHILALSTDTLVSGTHFFADTPATNLGWKTLAVSVSDLAAMAAQPRWASLSLTLPAVDEAWLAAFADGFYQCAAAFDIALVGGDTTRGPLAASVTLLGQLRAESALRRTGARAGDEIWISGTPGFAGSALAALQAGGKPAQQPLLDALHRPQPRLALGRLLARHAHAMIDVSDGLLADLGHILRASQVAAQIRLAALPLAPLVALGVAPEAALQAVLSGGDDYELLWTAPASAHDNILALGQTLALPLHCIGRIDAAAATGAVCLYDHDGRQRTPADFAGFRHFG